MLQQSRRSEPLVVEVRNTLIVNERETTAIVSARGRHHAALVLRTDQLSGSADSQSVMGAQRLDRQKVESRLTTALGRLGRLVLNASSGSQQSDRGQSLSD